LKHRYQFLDLELGSRIPVPPFRTGNAQFRQLDLVRRARTARCRVTKDLPEQGKMAIEHGAHAAI
jgi:hypothetical protein